MLNLKESTNSKKQGDVGMGIAIGYFASAGYTVAIPLTDSQDYDLVVEVGSNLKKVQVKTVYRKTPSGNYQVNLRVCGGNRSGQTVKMFDNTSVDYLFVVTDDNVKYLIPSNIITSTTVITLNDDLNMYKV
jgi:hypothetical protein